jgi:NitT/TauT family transport system permease protein
MAERAASGTRLRASAMRAMKPVLFLLILCVLWDVVVRALKIPPYLIPKPGDVIQTLWKDGPSLLAAAVPTLQATVYGFIVSVAFGIPVALLIVVSRSAEDFVYPLLVFSQSVPKVAIAPLFVVWFGFGLFPRVISAFLLAFFPIVVSAVQGLKAVEPDMIDLVRAMEASRLQVFRMVSLPHALPSIFAGLKVSITLAVVGAVVGEFVGANAGLGVVLQRSIGNFELPTMFAALVLLALIGVVLFWLVELAERLVIPWHTRRHETMLATA